ncbi:hypothetical protein QWT87_20005 [Chryseobacterium sp. APV1]|uniref:PRTase-CE domain-containing protein n=1 Tax=Chryseobacterium urinae TaxID=3058400 RepID=A0ABT8U7Y8_9FLAO|nr:hypothetical protein [Chryseobacterium sp. APV1]MDO3427167.1 hypothetical protein [Chryseobacterium sp. APV1]
MNDKNFEELLYKIKIFNETVWDRKVSIKKINPWLDNFKDEEKLDFLFLLTQFIYLSKFQIRNMLVSIYRDFIKYSIVEDFRMKNSHTLDAALIKENIRTSLLKTRFIPIGNPSESSSNLLYEFRTVNTLSTKLFIEESKIETLDNSIENFIFIDDICGSGSQVEEYTKNAVSIIKNKFPSAKIHYYTLVASEKGIDHVNKLNWFTHIDTVMKLDESYRCFSDKSRFFKNNTSIDPDKLKLICEKYGTKLIESMLERAGKPTKYATYHKLGFNDGQLLIGFDHNTPDNTLPIFWYDENITPWSSIFPRKHKVY